MSPTPYPKTCFQSDFKKRLEKYLYSTDNVFIFRKAEYGFKTSCLCSMYGTRAKGENIPSAGVNRVKVSILVQLPWSPHSLCTGGGRGEA
jgi:hypothetical protein